MIEIGRKIREFLQCTFVGVIMIKHANVKSMRASLLCCYDVIAHHSAYDVIARQKQWVKGFFFKQCMYACNETHNSC